MCTEQLIFFFWFMCIYTHCSHTDSTCGRRALFLFHHVCSAAGFYNSSAWSLKLKKKNSQVPFHLLLFFFPDTQPISRILHFSHEHQWATARDKWANWPTVYPTLSVCVCTECVWATNVCLFSLYEHDCMFFFVFFCFIIHSEQHEC